MPVQNFLEDEDYEPEVQPTEVRSAVPNFLQDEDYDDADSDEYYGGGFSDGVEAQSFGDGTGSFEGYEDDEDELFEGMDSLDGADEEDGEAPPSYGIIGLPQRAPIASVATPAGVGTDENAGSRTIGGTNSSSPMGTSAVEGDSDSDSFVPNFLADEDEDEFPIKSRAKADSVSSPKASVSTPDSNSSKGTLSTENSNAAERPQRSPLGSSEGSDSSSKVAPEAPRQRRDLSRRPQQVPSESSKGIPGSTTDPIQDAQPKRPEGVDRTPVAKSKVTSVAKSSSSASNISFDPKSAPKAPTDGEAEELKRPSSYAANRKLKYTALKQKDTTVRRVGADGLTPAERARAASATVVDALRTPANGKLSREELLFYANFGARRSDEFGGLSKKKLFIPPMLEENADQKKARETRINRALAGGSIARGAKTRLTEKDYRVLQFIAIFKFASERQIGKLLQVSEHAAYKRLNGLRKHGLTKGFKTLGVKGSVWVLTETGMDLSGFDLPRGTESALTLSMVSHQFTVNHVAAHLWTGGANVLKEKNFPQRNLPDGAGGFEFGERLISELQIQSAFGKVRGNSKADAYVPQIKKQMANLFDNWQRAGGVGYGPSPELIAGNEHMWTLFPPVSNRLNYHVPDLVVARPRSSDGKPQSIAVEVELRTKADDTSYERTLDAYRADDRIYRKVVWICRLKGTAEKLTRIAKRNGLADQGRIAIVPIYMEDGSRFTGKDTWSL